ncbi:sigma-70 family RNA polymerase sigma factor [Priestia megaterium]|uniref:Sigma-70 family RNA polymerase sigma factor n=1 Tax=Priestia megaterium TaxID=1404 RepID=A0A6M6DYT8_PRIMG|nr:sigma-70 family RNA polymerase sigma factor [Priestia megaterium]QJX80093.1 sigma-70 family RNA polymerase sigma factor [Priestia megaterium]
MESINFNEVYIDDAIINNAFLGMFDSKVFSREGTNDTETDDNEVYVDDVEIDDLKIEGLSNAEVEIKNVPHKSLNIRYLNFDQLVEQWSDLVWSKAREIKKTKGTTYRIDELYNFGLYGLWMAQEKYDESKETKFMTYAYWNIYYHILNEVKREKERQSGLNRCQYEKKEKIRKILNDRLENGWSLQQAEIESRLTKEEWNEAIYFLKCSKRKSLYQPVESKTQTSNKELIQFIQGDNSPEQKLFNLMERISLKLNETEKEIFKHLYILKYTQKETYEKFNLKKSTFEYRKKKLIDKIKNILINEQIPAT